MTTTAQTIHAAYLSRIQSAHTALFKLIENHHGELEQISYADAGISLKIAPSNPTSATVKHFCGANGRFVLGLDLTAPDARTASYLLIDTISAANNGALDAFTEAKASACAHIDKMDGYPTIFEWLPV